MKTELKYGLGLIFVMLLLAFIGVFIDLRTGFYIGVAKFPIGTYIFLLLGIVVFYSAFYLCIKKKRDKQFKGNLSWSQGIKTGLILSLIWAIALIFMAVSMWFDMADEDQPVPLLEKMRLFWNIQSIVQLSPVFALAILSGLLPTFIATFFLKRNSQHR